MKILYHANCNDGSAAALAAYMVVGDRADYVPVQYGSKPPEFDEGEDLIILDFSYKRDVLIEMAKKAGSILIIDHHKTARDDLLLSFPTKHGDDHLCDIDVIFDMEKCGAVLTWEYYHGDKPIPKLFKYIQDRDLWTKKLADTDAVYYGLQGYLWHEWIDIVESEYELNHLINEGYAIKGYLLKQAELVTEHGPTEWKYGADKVPVYNAPVFLISDMLHMALEKYPEAPYAVAYFDIADESKRVYSLRSRLETDVDVSEIAKLHGGVGHKHAAGFQVDLSP